MLSKLKFIALPKLDESPKSLLVRTACANGFRSVAHMARSLIPATLNAQPLSWQLQNSELVQVIAGDAGEYRELFLSGFYKQLSRVTADSPVIFSGVATPLTKLRGAKYAFCVECARDGWQRFSQDLAILETCPHHHCEFVHQCPDCETPLSWHQLDGTHCKCGFDLLSLEATRGTAHGSEAALRTYLSQDQEAVARLYASVRALRVEDGSTIQARQERLAKAGLIATAHRTALENAIQTARTLNPGLPKSLVLAPWKAIADGWIKEVVSEIDEAWKDENSSNLEVFPEPKIYFYRDELTSAFRVSPAKIVTLLKTNLLFRGKRKAGASWTYQSPDWNAAMTQAHENSAGRGNHQRDTQVDIHTAASMLNTYPEAVRRAVKAGVIPSVENKNIGVFITRESIDKFKKENIFIGDLAMSLGASNTTLQARLKAVGIVPFSGYRIDGGLVSIYKRSDLDQDKIKKSLELKTYPNSTGRKTTKSANNKILSSTDVAALLGVPMQRLQHFQNFGLLTPATRTEIDTDFRRYFTVTSVTRTKKWIESSVTMEDATAETKLSPQALTRRFISTGFIKVIKIGRSAFLSDSDLTKIKEHLKNYCSCDQADKYLNAPTGHTSNLISTRRAKTVPATETGIDSIRLLRWSDVKNLLK